MKGFFALCILIAGLSSTAAVPMKSTHLQLEKRYLLIEATKNSEGQYVCPDGYNKLDNNECVIKYRRVKRSLKHNYSDAENNEAGCSKGSSYREGACKLLVNMRSSVDTIEISCPDGYVYSNGQCSPI
ncbi:uncharacterized protein B0P05DRAFT_529684, partial [Gilbertella persicaria]|uniref:uncharacterized protein n=1 Tax=Gilbertella persicaria TaxID=101096 RepID=UPI00221EC866